MPEPTPVAAPRRSRIAVPDDARDLPGDFGHAHPIEVRFADTDAMGHVNNASYLTYCEIARVAYYERVSGAPLPLATHGAEEGMILAAITIAYRSPAFFGETLTVETRVERIGRTSFDMVHRLTAPASRYGPARLVAVADSVLVTYDYGEDHSIPMPAGLADGIEAYEGRPLRD
ncbi:MAG TPA: acyl-CoA thioesterase [Candidatus Limnocylindrales bacterium]|nr:acyl-CoA thioesterase [Candidatus Limnocylindrales bacterium]